MWRITKDHIEDGRNEGLKGGLSLTYSGEQLEFRLYDDDGVLYYEGWSDEANVAEDGGFGPLWDFGAPNAGCTEIHYKEDGKWNRL